MSLTEGCLCLITFGER